MMDAWDCDWHWGKTEPLPPGSSEPSLEQTVTEGSGGTQSSMKEEVSSKPDGPTERIGSEQRGWPLAGGFPKQTGKHE